MKLKNVHITEFLSIRNSNEFEIGDITCLVGKNEAGKTALLQALYRLNPIIETDGVYNITDDYPRRDEGDYRSNVEEGGQPHTIVAQAVFELEDEDVKLISDMFGDKALKKRLLTLSKGYENKRHVDLQLDEAAALQYRVTQNEFVPDVLSQLEDCGTADEMIEILAQAESTESVGELNGFLQNVQGHEGFQKYIVDTMLLERIPKFLYFDEYYQMEGRANIEALKERQQQNILKQSDYPLLGLIALARLDLDQLLNPSRTQQLKNSLESAGNHLTKSIIDYWSQNRHLQLRFDVRPARPDDPEGMRNGTNIWGDVYDSKHWVTTALGTRSRGFVWFFSFLAWYSDIQRQKKRVILLLDEPGLSLHAKAQEDLLRYFETELKGNHQVIYTTHSPFMVDPTRFDRVRIVQDLSIETDDDLPREEEGTKVLTDVLEATSDSLFPLQGALGYEIYQTLFVGPNSLVVEGVSDLLYLQTMSAVLQQKGRMGLSLEWTITPVGGSDKVPTFVALIGAQRKLNVAVLIDYQKNDRQTIENLYKRKLLEKKNVLSFTDFVSSDEADIEDMFDPDFYLKLVNKEFADSLSKPIVEADLNNQIPRIIVRLEKYFESNPLQQGRAFNHYRPARYFSENLGALEKEVSDPTLDRFEQAFIRLNSLL